ncbi:hypothetical protein [Cellulomonas sp. HD19AZ1]|uniref:hypothetical protein n=1 Tax=Cellulomonas sp. HD19AZ1 TaxID=2559593 RepID=UPI001070DCDE|nr:hypothetical protein [Cellulomonas sp. HD19AZ1]TFH68128.1 hypothetical protein E4A51_17950 [Cellulomonas sp. HD19AZ1]
MPGNSRRRPGRVEPIEAWAAAARAAGQRLDPRAIVAVGLAPHPLLASQVLTRWLVRHEAVPGTVLGPAALEELGVVDNVPPTQRRAQARFLLNLASGHLERHNAGALPHDEPRSLDAGDLSAAVGAPSAGRRPVRARPSRAQETSPRHVAAAIPSGAVRVADQRTYVAAVRAHPAFATLRQDAYRNVVAVAEHLALWAEWDTCTTRPTWAVLADRAGVSRPTVGRVVRRLCAAGLLGTVATGQSAHTATTSADQHGNLAAVYVLCVPGSLELVEQPVDESDTPPTTRSLKGSPTHARARGEDPEPTPLRGAALSGATRRSAPSPTSGQHTSRPPAPRSSPPRPDDARLTMAIALRERLPVLRRISDRHVAWIVRDFVEAGWTTSELAVAVDQRPDDTLWPHDGARGVRNVGRWLAHRLRAWRFDDGTVHTSPGARRQAEIAERRARQRAERERHSTRPLRLVAADTSPSLADVRAKIAAARAASRWSRS